MEQQQQQRERSVSPVAGSRAAAASRRPTYHHHFSHRRHYAVRRKLGRASVPKTAPPSIPSGFSDDSIEEVDEEEEEGASNPAGANLIVPIINVIQDSEVEDPSACHQEILSSSTCFSSINKDLLSLPNLVDGDDGDGDSKEEEER